MSSTKDPLARDGASDALDDPLRGESRISMLSANIAGPFSIIGGIGGAAGAS